MVLISLVCQCAACVVVVAWPGCVGLAGARGGAVGALQAAYGVPGHEQFTAALDLAQTLVHYLFKFVCIVYNFI